MALAYDLRRSDHETLRRLVHAGAEGVCLHEICQQSAILLDLLGLARVWLSGRKVYATPRGAAFSLRTAT